MSSVKIILWLLSIFLAYGQQTCVKKEIDFWCATEGCTASASFVNTVLCAEEFKTEVGGGAGTFYANGKSVASWTGGGRGNPFEFVVSTKITDFSTKFKHSNTIQSAEGHTTLQHYNGVAFLVYGRLTYWTWESSDELLSVPTARPTWSPTPAPTARPTTILTKSPSPAPTLTPTNSPTTVPTKPPTPAPTASPTMVPTDSPTTVPTKSPSPAPTPVPTSWPTSVPSDTPTLIPTESPTTVPTKPPTKSPTALPTMVPTDSPTMIPTEVPIKSSTLEPTTKPTPFPSATQKPRMTLQPTAVPTNSPTKSPDQTPTPSPTMVPTDSPIMITALPSTVPTLVPTFWPSSSPSSSPMQIPICTAVKSWSEALAKEQCQGHAHHAYEVELCDTYKNPDYHRRLEFALANQLWLSCSSKCVYDYDSYQTDNPLAFRWRGSCYDVNTNWCIKNVNSMEWSHAHAATLCGTGKACINVIEWTQEIAIENCPDGYGGSGDKGWGSAKICPTLVRLDDGFYERAHILYAASFNRSLANHVFHSCSAKCVYDIENNGVAYQWTEGDCWELQKDTGCINDNSKDYQWAFNFLNEGICPNDIPPDNFSLCVERETEWTEEIAQAICTSNDMGTTNKGSTASVCSGFENYQSRLDDSLANRVFLKCDSKCVYDIYESGDAAFRWKDAISCWKPVSSGGCFQENDIEKISKFINNILCEEREPSSPTPGPTSAPTTPTTALPTWEPTKGSVCVASECIPQQEWSEDLMDAYCSPDETGVTYKHHCHIGRAAVPCPAFKELAEDLKKSLAVRLYNDCSSTCVFDYSSGAMNAWKWSTTDLCWELQAWGSCHWDYKPAWDAAKVRISLMCQPSPTCIPYYVWDKDRAEELCPSVNTIDTPISYGVEACEDAQSKMKQLSLFKSLANKFYQRCTSLCVYDYDTIIKNYMYDYSIQAGFQWSGKCWKWVTDGDCFSKSSNQYAEIYLHAQDLCNVTDPIIKN